MKACLLACFCRVAKLKAFRQVRKTASRVRKGITGKSSKQALEESRKIQAELKRHKVEAKQEHNVKHDYEENASSSNDRHLVFSFMDKGSCRTINWKRWSWFEDEKETKITFCV